MVDIHAIETPRPVRPPRVHANVTLHAEGDGLVTSATADQLRIFTADGSAALNIRGSHADLIVLLEHLTAQLHSAKTDAPLTRNVPT